MTDRHSKLADAELDLLVVGGGIVGSGVARDAAMRSLRVGLVEQHDLAFGTSSRSTRLLHGGLRYLAQGRVGLVREASREKCVIQRIAPHLADPLPFIFPTYKGDGWPLWQLKVGMKIYDALCGRRNLGPSTWASTAKTLDQGAGLRGDGLTGSVRYFDGLTNDARLVLDTLRSAANHDAVISNYTRLESARPSRGGWKATLADVLSGQTLEVFARTIVNATGPWSEQLPQSGVRLRLTKGVHLVVDRKRLPVPDSVIMTEGKRILFAIPWGERVILGTTDTDYEDRIEAVRTEPEDIRYVLDVVNAFFPAAALDESDVISEWAGLRPLIAAKGGKPSDISRAHQILSPQGGWFDVAGGKLTTYRLIGEQTVDRVVKRLGVSVERCRTAQEPLLAAEDVKGISSIIPPEMTAPLVRHYCENEWAVHLDDVMLRRGGWHFYHTDADARAQKVAAWMADVLGWDTARAEDELTRYRERRAER